MNVRAIAQAAFGWFRRLWAKETPDITIGLAELTPEDMVFIEADEAPKITTGEAELTAEELNAIAEEESIPLTAEEIETVERLTKAYVEASPEDKAAIVKGPGLADEAQKAFIRSREEIMKLPAVVKLKPRWKFVAVVDERTSHVCRALDGTCLEAGDPRWSTMLPPLHPHCRSHVAPVDVTEEIVAPTTQALEILSQTVKP